MLQWIQLLVYLIGISSPFFIFFIFLLVLLYWYEFIAGTIRARMAVTIDALMNDHEPITLNGNSASIQLLMYFGGLSPVYSQRDMAIWKSQWSRLYWSGTFFFFFFFSLTIFFCSFFSLKINQKSVLLPTYSGGWTYFNLNHIKRIIVINRWTIINNNSTEFLAKKTGSATPRATRLLKPTFQLGRYLWLTFSRIYYLRSDLNMPLSLCKGSAPQNSRIVQSQNP